MNDFQSYTKFTTERYAFASSTDPRIEQLKHWCREFDKYNLAPIEGMTSAGNMSFRLVEGKDSLVTTASGTIFGGDLAVERFVEVRDIDLTKKIVYASCPKNIVPSSETIMHFILYQHYRNLGENVNCIFHGHYNPFLERAAELELSMTDKFIPYGTLELAEAVRDIANRGSRFLLIKGHGFISLGVTPEEAGNRTLEMYKKAQ